MTARPALLIDVDGPLNPYARSNRQHVRDKEFQLYKLLSFKVWLKRWHGEQLLALADRYELMWATTWEHDANRFIGPKLGLPDLPVIEFPSSPSQPDARIYYKTPTILTAMAGRPFAWVDDEISTWDEKYVIEHHDAPALLRSIDPVFGLREDDFQALADWAATLKTP